MKEDRVQPRRFAYARFIVGIMSIIVSVGLVRSIIGHWQKRSVVSERLEAFKIEQARNQELKVKLEEATSAAFIEKEAREKLGLAKEGDTIVLLDTSQLVKTSEPVEAGDGLPNWKKWWKLFF